MDHANHASFCHVESSALIPLRITLIKKYMFGISPEGFAGAHKHTHAHAHAHTQPLCLDGRCDLSVSADKSRTFLKRVEDEGGTKKKESRFLSTAEVVSVLASVLFNPFSVRLHFIAIGRLKAWR